MKSLSICKPDKHDLEEFGWLYCLIGFFGGITPSVLIGLFFHLEVIYVQIMLGCSMLISLVVWSCFKIQKKQSNKPNPTGV